MRSTVYNLGVSLGTKADWQFVHDQYLTELVASEKVNWNSIVVFAKAVHIQKLKKGLG